MPDHQLTIFVHTTQRERAAWIQSILDECNKPFILVTDKPHLYNLAGKYRYLVCGTDSRAEILQTNYLNAEIIIIDQALHITDQFDHLPVYATSRLIRSAKALYPDQLINFSSTKTSVPELP